jgi:hypothetical protein
MFETFKAIKGDPRSSTGVFCALKRHTSCDSESVHVVSDGEGEVPLIEVVRDPSKIEGLPEEVPGRVVIVSDITYQAAKPLGRKDLVKVGPAVRDDSGSIIGCQGLAI